MNDLVTHRLLIKSTICAADMGLWNQEERDGEGNVITPRIKIKDAIKFPDDMEGVDCTVDLTAKELHIQFGEESHTLPIPPEAMAQQGIR